LRGQGVAGILLLGIYLGFVQAACLVLYPFLRLLVFLPGSFGEGLKERLGLLKPRIGGGDLLWVHAASVGEANAIRPLLKEISRAGGGKKILVSVMTSSGKKRMKSVIASRVVHPPLDAPLCVARFIKRMRPGALIVAETELWPVMITFAARRMPVFWVNGRISDRSYPRYRLFRPLMRRILGGISGFFVISKTDAARVIDLGAPASRVRVMGNLKADMVGLGRIPRGVNRGEWFVAGSTRPGEEEQVLEAFRMLKGRHPRARLVIAPRHLGRIGEVAELVEHAGLSVSFRSRGYKPDTPVLLLDTHGELASFYRLAKAAFVGGTLVPVGGHSVLEPALAGSPVFIGPFTGNVRDETAALLKSGGAYRVRSGRELGAKLASAWGKRGLAEAGRRARSCSLGLRGAAGRIAKALANEGVI